MDAGSVDAIITDVPYGMTANAWDVIIPFEPMWKAVYHVLKPDGTFITSGIQPFTSKIIMSNLNKFRFEMIWKKNRSTGFLAANKKPLKNHENVVIFGGKTYNPQLEIGKKYVRSRPAQRASCYEDVGAWKTENYGFRYPKSVIEINAEAKTVHGTQKPVALYSYLINSFTNEGDTVMDITMGSGTTGVAAVQLGRNFVGCELDAGYFKIAEKRIYDATRQQQLFAVWNKPREVQEAF